MSPIDRKLHMARAVGGNIKTNIPRTTDRVAQRSRAGRAAARDAEPATDAAGQASADMFADLRREFDAEFFLANYPALAGATAAADHARLFATYLDHVASDKCDPNGNF